MLVFNEKPDVVNLDINLKNQGLEKPYLTQWVFFYMKALLRQYYRQLRRSISSGDRIIAEQACAKIIMSDSRFNFYQKNIAVYLSNDGEMELQFLIKTLWQNQNKLFLPVINATTNNLQFGLYSPTTVLKKNQYGINEPENDFLISPEALDIVFMPLVAFDKTGARLGMGKGYYDKTFTFCFQARTKPALIGVAYSCQYCDRLPIESWDVPLDGILTEKEFLFFKREK